MLNKHISSEPVLMNCIYSNYFWANRLKFLPAAFVWEFFMSVANIYIYLQKIEKMIFALSFIHTSIFQDSICCFTIYRGKQGTNNQGFIINSLKTSG